MDQNQYTAVSNTRPQPSEPSPKESVGRLELRAFDAVLIDRELVSQGEDFQLHGVTRLEP